MKYERKHQKTLFIVTNFLSKANLVEILYIITVFNQPQGNLYLDVETGPAFWNAITE